ncbi:hypothetical protein VW35_03825 [Devosia soli]|uniref:Universal stress protein n=1 Tax=Devosia soli TaxID=361041 RepID=A0A0F5LFZ1_9HYPH|nr:universal stress protein [Devosia soli]KKB81258.1 hypothetical protein VW35_03825 [Devosia soli]
MYSRIICAIDGSDLSNKALNHAFMLANKLGAELTAVTITDPAVMLMPGADAIMVDTGAVAAELEKAKDASAKAILANAEKLAAAAGVPLKTLHLPSMPAAEGIVRGAKDVGANLIVMGSHGRRGLGRLLLGSQAAEVLAHSDIPVLIVK